MPWGKSHVYATPSLPDYGVIVQRVLGASQETVTHIVRVNIVSGDHVDWIVAKRDRALERACARARNIERCDGALHSAYEAMNYITCVEVLSHHHSGRVDVLWYAALAGAGAYTRRVECGDRAV